MKGVGSYSTAREIVKQALICDTRCGEADARVHLESLGLRTQCSDRRTTRDDPTMDGLRTLLGDLKQMGGYRSTRADCHLCEKISLADADEASCGCVGQLLDLLVRIAGQTCMRASICLWRVFSGVVNHPGQAAILSGSVLRPAPSACGTSSDGSVISNSAPMRLVWAEYNKFMW